MESQTHLPLVLQCCPDEHVWHVPPPVPHVLTDCVWHAFPLQQPLGQDVPSQTHFPALLQVRPLQLTHAAPLMPQVPLLEV